MNGSNTKFIPRYSHHEARSFLALATGSVIVAEPEPVQQDVTGSDAAALIAGQFGHTIGFSPAIRCRPHFPYVRWYPDQPGDLPADTRSEYLGDQPVALLEPGQFKVAYAAFALAVKCSPRPAASR